MADGDPAEESQLSGLCGRVTPETRFAQNGDISIAYQVFGEESRDLVVIPGWLSNLDIDLRPILPTIVSPTLVLQAIGGLTTPLESGQDFANGIPAGFEFEDFGTHDLKGIPDRYQIFSLAQ